jgi:hypothetical protein
MDAERNTGQVSSQKARGTPLLIISAMVLAYFLSTGPVIRLYLAGLVPKFAIEIYTPLDAVCGVAPPLDQLVDAYLTLWGIQ